MSAQISIHSIDDTRFEVVIRDEASETRHIVTVDPAYAGKLAGAHFSTADLIRRSFEFLLEREPKESILRTFNLRDISHYFADYQAEIRRRLARKE